MRTIKELLILLREFLPGNITKEEGGCICNTLTDMVETGVMESLEKVKLREYIYSNRPEDTKGKMFWWPYGELAPRLEFLDKLISEL